MRTALFSRRLVTGRAVIPADGALAKIWNSNQFPGDFRSLAPINAFCFRARTDFAPAAKAFPPLLEEEKIVGTNRSDCWMSLIDRESKKEKKWKEAGKRADFIFRATNNVYVTRVTKCCSPLVENGWVRKGRAMEKNRNKNLIIELKREGEVFIRKRSYRGKYRFAYFRIFAEETRRNFRYIRQISFLAVIPFDQTFLFQVSPCQSDRFFFTSFHPKGPNLIAV